jgi:hypothetical protein
MRLLAALLLLAACSAFETPTLSNGTPVVRAVDGSSASITIVTCPPTLARAQGVGEIIRDLVMQDELVVARSGGNARLTINACPSGTIVTAPGRAR